MTRRRHCHREEGGDRRSTAVDQRAQVVLQLRHLAHRLGADRVPGFPTMPAMAHPWGDAPRPVQYCSQLKAHRSLGRSTSLRVPLPWLAVRQL